MLRGWSGRASAARTARWRRAAVDHRRPADAARPARGFLRVRRFGELQQNTGLARNILADRLQALVGAGILERREYQDRPQRFEYRLTQKGLDLYPILLGLMEWGAKYGTGKEGTLVTLRHTACGHVGSPPLSCPGCGEPVTRARWKRCPARARSLRAERLRLWRR